MKTVIIDYESGNLHSAEKAFRRMAEEAGAGEVIVTSDPEVVRGADRVVGRPEDAPARRRLLLRVEQDRLVVAQPHQDARVVRGCTGAERHVA